MLFATFEVLSMHVFYNVLEKARKGELKPEKLCRYHKNCMRYGTFNFEKYRCKLCVPPLEKNPQIQPVILFQQIQLCCICDVTDDHSKNKRRKWE